MVIVGQQVFDEIFTHFVSGGQKIFTSDDVEDDAAITVEEQPGGDTILYFLHPKTLPHETQLFGVSTGLLDPMEVGAEYDRLLLMSNHIYRFYMEAVDGSIHDRYMLQGDPVTLDS